MPEQIVTRILRLTGYGVFRAEFEESLGRVILWVRANGPDAEYHECGGCGISTRRIVDFRERRVRDLPWGEWEVWLVLEVHRLRCERCGLRTERFAFLDGKAQQTARFRRAVARDCEDAPAERVASKWKLSAETVRRIDKAALRAWLRQRDRTPLRKMGVDEIFWKAGKCLTVVSDLELGEPIWAAADRKRATLDEFFLTQLNSRERGFLKVACIDMWAPFIQSIRLHAPKVVIVFDKFHVMRYVSQAVDETRRQEFFRQHGNLRALARGKRWLLLRRWDNLNRGEKTELQALFAVNKRLFRAHLLKESISRLWECASVRGARRFFAKWVSSLRWQRLPAFRKLAGTLERHLDGILSFYEHPVPFGVVEAINGNIRAVIRRGRGYTDSEYLILKVRRATFLRQAELLAA